MPVKKLCSNCGGEILPVGPAGLCATCLLAPALEADDAAEAVQSPDLRPILTKPAAPLIIKFHSFGDYELLAEVARGGMGVVFRARQVSLNRIVALKFIHPGRLASADAARRFEIEAETVASLDHPNIVPIYEVGQHDGHHYFSMKLVEGGTLADRIRDYQLPIADPKSNGPGFSKVEIANRQSQVARLVMIIGRAVHHAHERGILHRDLKPGNILLDSHGEPYLTDFGLAKVLATESHLTLTADVLGSPHYMAPEQAGGKRQPLRTATDTYSLGCILYELLAGRPPFQGETPLEILQQVRDREPTALRMCNPAVDQDLETICLKCLHKEPHRRYGSAEALANDLERWIRQEPIQARPVSTTTRLSLWCRRKPSMAALLASLFCVGAVGLAGILWQWLEARSQAARADAHATKALESQEKFRRLLYASDMHLAQQALKVNNVGQARRLLERNRPEAGEADLRGWEWRYLWQLTRSSALMTLTNRPIPGTAISFSPDGTYLAVGWSGGRVDLWDVAGRRYARSLTEREYGHHHGQVTFSPVRNLLAATSDADEIVLYDLDSGRQSKLFHTPNRDAWDIRDLSFSKDGSRLVIYCGGLERFGDAVWVVNVASSEIEGRYSTLCSNSGLHGAARLSPDNKRLYLARSDFANYRYSIQCLDLTTGQEVWETEPEVDYGLTALAISPDGRSLASGSGFEDATIRIWDVVNGHSLRRLDGHSGWVCKLAFTRDGTRLFSAASDQSIRLWDTSNWTEKVLRGHTDEVYAVAISEQAQLTASVGKDGNLILWKGDGKDAADGYKRLPGKLRINEVAPLDHLRVLLLPPGHPPEWIDLKREFAPVSLAEISSSTNAFAFYSTNILCRWNGTNRMLVHEWRGDRFIQQGAISLDSSTPPRGFIYHAGRQLLAWTQLSSPTSIYLASLATSDRRIELKGDLPGLVRFWFSEDGKYLAATGEHDHSLRAWNVETGLTVASINERARAVGFAAGGRVLVLAIEQGNDHEIAFYDLDHSGQAARRVPGKGYATTLAVSPDGALVASATSAGQVRLFDPFKGELIDFVHGHLNGASCVAFSPDGRRLISTSGGREAVKLWDVTTRPAQELITLAGIGSLLEVARWSAAGDVILCGPPWQAWHAPSWTEIAEAEAKDVSVP